jgi:hypothetical protein
LLKSGKAFNIKYCKNNREYNLYVPYDRQLLFNSSNCKVILQLDEDNVEDITQQPGIPYLVSAYELGGISASVYNNEDMLLKKFLKHETIDLTLIEFV